LHCNKPLEHLEQQGKTMNIKTMKVIPATVVAVFLVAACATTPPSNYDAMAALSPASGSQISGSVNFRVIPGGLHADIAVTGMTPGAHGFHIHEVGDCSAADASSAKGHFNPFGKPHGSFDHGDHHAGDLPNLTADADGKAVASMDLPGLAIGAGETNIVGRSVVIHADLDDTKSQPAGNSGKRVACGVIKSI
jgi:Cu-Zn family superoxide dismutase